MAAYSQFPGKTYDAPEILKDYKKLLPELKGRYLLLKDTSVGRNFDLMTKAINLLAHYGWEPTLMTINDERLGSTMYVMVGYMGQPEKAKREPPALE